MKIAFIGLGTMGYPMAGHLAAHHDVTVCNRSPAKAERWKAQYRGAAAATPANCVRDAQAVLVCLPTDKDSCSVALGEGGVFEAMSPGAVFVDHGSGSVETARALAREAESRGLGYLDAPVTGGRIGAENGVLAVMVGGDPAALAKVEPALHAFAREVQLMGAVGAGHITKMLNVIIGHAATVAMAEAISFAINAGLDPARAVEVLMKGSSRSWQLEHRSGAMIDRNYRTEYPVKFARKDLGNALAAGKANGSIMPLSATADQLYAALERRGLSEADTVSMIEYFAPAPPVD